MLVTVYVYKGLLMSAIRVPRYAASITSFEDLAERRGDLNVTVGFNSYLSNEWLVSGALQCWVGYFSIEHDLLVMNCIVFRLPELVLIKYWATI